MLISIHSHTPCCNKERSQNNTETFYHSQFLINIAAVREIRYYVRVYGWGWSHDELVNRPSVNQPTSDSLSIFNAFYIHWCLSASPGLNVYPQSVLPVDGLTPWGYGTSVSTVRTNFGRRIFIGSGVDGFHHDSLDTLRPRQNGHHLVDDVLKCIFLNGNVTIKNFVEVRS